MSDYSMQALSPVKVIESTTNSYPVGTSLVDADILDWTARNIMQAFETCGMEFDPARLREIPASVIAFYRTFLPTLATSQINVRGSTTVQGLLPLWIISRLVRPDTLIESGVYVGSSLRMFRQAVPTARMLAYDISFTRLEFREDSIEYHETDWMQKPPPEIGPDQTAMAFFDDHINAVQRLEEARQRRIEWVIFDDNPNIGSFGGYRYPSLPSIPMIVDPEFPDGGVVEWRSPRSEKPLRYEHDAASCAAIRPHIGGVLNIGALMSGIGMACGDKWLLRLT